MVHELATNAAKYGALSVAGGQVSVGWSITGHRPPRLEFVWKEASGPKIDGLMTRGFGTELIERGIRFELEGEAKLEVADGSLQCRIIVPADPKYLTFGSLPDTSKIEDAAS